jgi:hypothetical protein
MNLNVITTRGGWYTEAAYLAGYEDNRAWIELEAGRDVKFEVRIRPILDPLRAIIGYTVSRTQTRTVDNAGGPTKRVILSTETDHTLLRDARRELRRLSKGHK